jgi:hypothetical protein
MRAASDFWSAKTTWLGLGMVALAAYRGYSKAISWDQAIPEMFAGFGLIFVRDAFVKAEEKTAEKVTRTIKKEMP